MFAYFQIAFETVFLAMLFAVPGYLLARFGKANAEHIPTLSAILVYGCTPPLIVSSFVALDFSWEMLGGMGLFFVISLAAQLLFMGILWLLLHKKFDDAKYRILTIGAVLGNTGYFGLPIIRAILPGSPEVACYACMYSVSMNVLVFTIGVFALTRDKKYMSLRAAIFNPTVLSLPVALALFGLGAKSFLPPFLVGGMELLSRMTVPLCMTILGIRLANVKIGRLFSRGIMYVAAGCKLVLFPLFAYALVLFLPLPFPFKAAMLIISAAPCGTIIYNLAEMHKSEQELAANVVLLSTLLCVATIPVMALLLGASG